MLVGELFSAVNKTSYKSYRTTKELYANLNVVQIKDAFILIKGSRGMKLEQLVNNL
jgi:UDP-N-acetylmuramoyl-tripeptide--D-alanyl-D-alanine ligase